jgi:hypothetical protein
MEEDFYRLTPAFWKRRLEGEPVSFLIQPISGKYGAIENILKRPYGKYWGLSNTVNKILAWPFSVLRRLPSIENDYPMGVSVIILKK